MTDARYIQLHDFLESDEVDRLVAHVAERLDVLAPSSVYQEDSNTDAIVDTYRRSRVDTKVDDVVPLFEERLRALLPHLRREFGVARFEPGDTEYQLTVHGDGDFFSLHVDDSQPGTNWSRAITFVYYFNAEPCEFEGGLLRLHSSDGGHAEPVEVTPVNNSIVFFPADRSHEVTPIRALGDGLGALRCTVNGWFRYGDTGRPKMPTTPDVVARLHQAVLPRFTSAGFSVLPTPRAVHLRLAAFLARSRQTAAREHAPVAYFPAGDPDLIPIGSLGDELLAELQPLHERWAGISLLPVSAYGLRVYRSGQRMVMHTDRPESHVISSVIHVDHHLDEPWPFRFDDGGMLHEIDIPAGTMVMYEGAACPHGRPAPMQGTSYTSLFLHYRPVEWNFPQELIGRLALERGLIDARGGATDRIDGVRSAATGLLVTPRK